MSFGRFSEYDVYLFPTTNRDGQHMWECCGCILEGRGPTGWGNQFQTSSLAAYLDHVDEHRQVGHDAPEPDVLRARCLDWAEHAGWDIDIAKEASQ